MRPSASTSRSRTNLYHVRDLRLPKLLGEPERHKPGKNASSADPFSTPSNLQDQLTTYTPKGVPWLCSEPVAYPDHAFNCGYEVRERCRPCTKAQSCKSCNSKYYHVRISLMAFGSFKRVRMSAQCRTRGLWGSWRGSSLRLPFSDAQCYAV